MKQTQRGWGNCLNAHTSEEQRVQVLLFSFVFSSWLQNAEFSLYIRIGCISYMLNLEPLRLRAHVTDLSFFLLVPKLMYPEMTFWRPQSDVRTKFKSFKFCNSGNRASPPMAWRPRSRGPLCAGRHRPTVSARDCFVGRLMGRCDAWPPSGQCHLCCSPLLDRSAAPSAQNTPPRPGECQERGEVWSSIETAPHPSWALVSVTAGLKKDVAWDEFLRSQDRGKWRGGDGEWWVSNASRVGK